MNRLTAWLTRWLTRNETEERRTLRLEIARQMRSRR